MERTLAPRLSREDWLREALKVLRSQGIDGIKIVAMAQDLGVTSGSFYWHFSNLRDLLDDLLDYWERELTDTVIVKAKEYRGLPEERILNLMLQVIEEDAAIYDHAISIWAKEDPTAKKVFERTLQKRFDFARWMFRQAGFADRQAAIRGRMLVAYMMGESASDLKSNRNWKSTIREMHKVLTTGSDQPATAKK